MNSILENQRFAEMYRRLADVSLNPRRHTAANALEHSEAVAARAVLLAQANQCSPPEVSLLENLGRAHDIGEVTGTARPDRSLDVLRECGIDAPELMALVKWHDTSLPWYLAQMRGSPPSEKAWRRLHSEVDLRLLTLFMVADRVDAPPGWRRNAPTTWFLDQARRRGFISGLTLDLPHHPSEIVAGGALVRGVGATSEVLLIRATPAEFELPTEEMEWDELPEEAAQRALRSATGLSSTVHCERELGSLDYLVEEANERRLKRVRYFLLRATTSTGFDELPQRAGDRRWVNLDGMADLPLINENLRGLVRDALEN